MPTFESIREKILSQAQVQELFTPAFRSHKRIVFTNGCFDILHRGHVYYLALAREMGDLLVLGLNSDDSVRRLKGEGRPVNDEEARAEVLAALQMVDYVVLFEEDTPLNLIQTVKPQVLVKGGDYREEDIVGYREVISWGGTVRTIPVREGYSSSNIIDRIS